MFCLCVDGLVVSCIVFSRFNGLFVDSDVDGCIVVVRIIGVLVCCVRCSSIVVFFSVLVLCVMIMLFICLMLI